MLSLDAHGSHAGVQLRTYERFRPNENQFIIKSYKIQSSEEGYRKARDIELFCNEANKLGIVTPHQCVFVAPVELTTGRPSGEMGLYLSQEYAGPTMTQAIAQGSDPFPLIELYLQQHAKVYAAGNMISLDPPLANFSQNGVLIDVFPPRHKMEGQPLVEYNINPDMPKSHKQFLEDRYFGQKQAVVIFAQIMRALKDRPQSGDLPFFILDVMSRIMGPHSAHHVKEALQLDLEHIQPTDIDVIRALACMRHAEGYLSANHVKMVYDHTHITGETGELPSQEMVERARDMLLIPNN